MPGSWSIRMTGRHSAERSAACSTIVLSAMILPGEALSVRDTSAGTHLQALHAPRLPRRYAGERRDNDGTCDRGGCPRTARRGHRRGTVSRRIAAAVGGSPRRFLQAIHSLLAGTTLGVLLGAFRYHSAPG